MSVKSGDYLLLSAYRMLLNYSAPQSDIGSYRETNISTKKNKTKKTALRVRGINLDLCDIESVCLPEKF